jgi:hypothetical protein
LAKQIGAEVNADSSADNQHKSGADHSIIDAATFPRWRSRDGLGARDRFL